MESNTYKFDPTEFGFEDISSFQPVFTEYFYSGYIKVVALHEFNTFWFKVCSKINLNDDRDDRWQIYSGGYSKRNPYDIINNKNEIRTVYSGIISSKEYATLLLQNLLSAMDNSSLLDGFTRLNDREMNNKAKRI